MLVTEDLRFPQRWVWRVCLLECDAVQLDRNLLTYPRNWLPSSVQVYHEYGGARFLWNVETLPSRHTAPPPRRCDFYISCILRQHFSNYLRSVGCKLVWQALYYNSNVYQVGRLFRRIKFICCVGVGQQILQITIQNSKTGLEVIKDANNDSDSNSIVRNKWRDNVSEFQGWRTV
jgi:hypothetical protein